MRAALVLGLLLGFAALTGAHSPGQAPMPPQAPERPGVKPGTPQQIPPAPQQQPSAPPQTLPPPVTPPPERPSAPVAVTVILDPAHGGADSGAHGDPSEEGAVEKDLVLAIALTMRSELQRQGVRVLMTRQDDTGISINDRAAVANGASAGFFVSLHVGSTGPDNTAETYSFGATQGGAPPAFLPRAHGIDALRWDEAQAGYAIASRRIAELIQVELAQKLPRSPDFPHFAEVRQLRVVARPAVAIELSRVAQTNPAGLEKSAVPLAAALVRAIAAYRSVPEGRP